MQAPVKPTKEEAALAEHVLQNGRTVRQCMQASQLLLTALNNFWGFSFFPAFAAIVSEADEEQAVESPAAKRFKH